MASVRDGWQIPDVVLLVHELVWLLAQRQDRCIAQIDAHSNSFPSPHARRDANGLSRTRADSGIVANNKKNLHESCSAQLKLTKRSAHAIRSLSAAKPTNAARS